MSFTADPPSPTLTTALLKQAIEAGKKYLAEIFPSIGLFQFEEVRHFSSPSPRFCLTFSYSVPERMLPQYKVVELDADTLGLLQVLNR